MSTNSNHPLADRLLLVLEAAVGIAVVAAILGTSYGFTATAVFLLASVATAYTGFVVFKMVTAVRDEGLDVVGRIRDHERESMEEEKRLLLLGIKELEADAGIGKVDRGDYEHLRRTAEARALEIIRRLRELDERWMVEARRVASSVAGPLPALAHPDNSGKETVATGSTQGGNATSAPRTDSLQRETETETGTGRTPAAEPMLGPSHGRPSHAGRNQALSGDPVSRPSTLLFDDRPVEFSEVGEGGLSCGACGERNPVTARFCIGCGRPRLNAPTSRPASSKDPSADPSKEPSEASKDPSEGERR